MSAMLFCVILLNICLGSFGRLWIGSCQVVNPLDMAKFNTDVLQIDWKEYVVYLLEAGQLLESWKRGKEKHVPQTDFNSYKLEKNRTCEAGFAGWNRSR